MEYEKKVIATDSLNRFDRLESVVEYNERVRKEREAAEDVRTRTGVACPACGNELRWAAAPAPPGCCSRTAYCSKCWKTAELEQL